MYTTKLQDVIFNTKNYKFVSDGKTVHFKIKLNV